ncbi:hypothetical protein KY284_005130 [Solanum tuberosum]|nr:hypothetical protein KY284_005130 [Solanum tuberosum]
MLIFQDSCIDAIGSLLVYRIVNSQEINVMIRGVGDSSFVHILPNGISIVQDCSATYNDNGIFGKNDNGVYSGSLVTIGFQMMENNLFATNLHLEFLSQDGDAFALTKLCSLQRSFSYNEPATPAKVGDVTGELHLRMPIAGVGSRLRLAIVPVEPKEFGELCSCKLILYRQHHTCGNGSALSVL